jgi:hypothetical protein
LIQHVFLEARVLSHTRGECVRSGANTPVGAA